MLRPRWTPRCRQWTLAQLMILIAGVGLILALARWPTARVVALASIVAVAAGLRLMARRGFSLVDILAVLAFLLIVLGLLLPAMAHTRFRSAGRETFPSLVPTRFARFLGAD